MKKKIMFVVPALASGLALAQEEATTAAEQMFSEATALVSEVQPLLVSFLVLAFGITIAFVAYKLAKRGANKV